MIEKNVKLDMEIGVVPVLYTLQQTEIDSRKIIITFVASGTPINISEYSSIVLQLDKPDGTTVIESTSGDYLNIVDNKLELTFSKQMSITSGMSVGKIMFYKGQTMLSSTLFKINVEGGLKYDNIISSSEFNALVDALAEVSRLSTTEEIFSTSEPTQSKGNFWLQPY